MNQTDCESDLMPSKAGRNISDQMGAKDCYNQKLEGTTLSEIFVREISLLLGKSQRKVREF